MSTQHAPGPWLTNYAHDRRSARHRCRVCNRIVNEGESVWMARVAYRVTKVIHAEDCAGKPLSGSITSLDLLGMHAALWVHQSPMSDEQALSIARAAIAKATGEQA